MSDIDFKVYSDEQVLTTIAELISLLCARRYDLGYEKGYSLGQAVPKAETKQCESAAPEVETKL